MISLRVGVLLEIAVYAAYSHRSPFLAFTHGTVFAPLSIASNIAGKLSPSFRRTIDGVS